MRMLTIAIGYVATATMLSAALGFAYLWQTQRLDDEKVFRIVALMHDVDIDGMAEEEATDESETPAEEPSLDDIQRYRAISDRNFEVKQDALKRGRQEFEKALRDIEEEKRRFKELTDKLEAELEREGELSNKESVSKVVRDLELVKPDIAKGLLLRTLKQPDGMKDVILLMNAMSTSKLKKILTTFRTDEELDDLHEIHLTMLNGGTGKGVLEEALRQLKGLKGGP